VKNNDKPIDSWTFRKWQDRTLLSLTLLMILSLAAGILRPGLVTLALLVILVGVWLLVLYFFRDPDRQVLDEPGLVVGPGDGKVVAIEAKHEDRHLKVDTVRISIFLSILDVHVQRAPLAGRVASVEHRPGAFLQAFKPEASQLNDRISMVMETEHGRILVDQIAGILARRCINFARPGDRLLNGQRYGLIKFGSRVDLYLPPEAEILVQLGDQVHGGLTPVARFRDHGNPDAQ
jgi:phosphatidylserine decarboxylase